MTEREDTTTWTRMMRTVPKAGSPNPKRARRVLSEDDERFLRDIEKTHLAKDPSVEDLFGETHGLEPIGEKAALGEYFKELWQRRHFIWRESRNKVFNKLSNIVLGPLGLVLTPLLNAAF